MTGRHHLRADEAGVALLAAVLDTFSRKIVGWSMADHMETQLVSDALQMALQRRRPAGARLLHHSGRGSVRQLLLPRQRRQASSAGHGTIRTT